MTIPDKPRTPGRGKAIARMTPNRWRAVIEQVERDAAEKALAAARERIEALSGVDWEYAPGGVPEHHNMVDRDAVLAALAAPTTGVSPAVSEPSDAPEKR